MSFDILNSHVTLSGVYLLYLTFGVISVLLFSGRMIAQPTYLSDEKKDPIGLFAPKLLTFPAKYRLASVSYCFLLLLSYLLLVFVLDNQTVSLPSLLGDKTASQQQPERPREQIAAKPAEKPDQKPGEQHSSSSVELNPAVPLLLALMLIGVLPRIQLVEMWEKRLREWVHEIFLIPSLGRSTAGRIATAAIGPDPSIRHCLEKAEGEALERLLDLEFSKSLSRLEFIVGIRERMSNEDIAKCVDADHIGSYAARFEVAEQRAHKFCNDVKEAGAIVRIASDGGRAAGLIGERLEAERQALDDEIRFLSVVVAGAVLRRASNEKQVNHALELLGLNAPKLPIESRAGDKAIFISLCVSLAYWIWGVGGYVLRGLWSGSASGIADAVVWQSFDATITFFSNTVVLSIVFAYQLKAKTNGTWAAGGDKGYARPTAYLRLTMLAVLVGSLVLFGVQAILFGVWSRPAGGPDWVHMMMLGFVQSLPMAVVGLFVILLSDCREAVPADSVWPSLWSAIFLVVAFFAGFVVKYVSIYVAMGADSSGASATLSDDDLRQIYLSGLRGAWLLAVVAVAISSDVRRAIANALTGPFSRPAPR